MNFREEKTVAVVLSIISLSVRYLTFCISKFIEKRHKLTNRWFITHKAREEHFLCWSKTSWYAQKLLFDTFTFFRCGFGNTNKNTVRIRLLYLPLSVRREKHFFRSSFGTWVDEFLPIGMKCLRVPENRYISRHMHVFQNILSSCRRHTSEKFSLANCYFILFAFFFC